MTQRQLAPHTHPLRASTQDGNTGSATNNIFGNTGTGDNDYGTYPDEAPFPALTAMSPMVIAMAGAGEPINNMMKGLGINYMIAIAGIFPPRP